MGKFDVKLEEEEEDVGREGVFVSDGGKPFRSVKDVDSEGANGADAGTRARAGASVE